MLSTKRKPFATGQSKGITLPASMKISDTGISMAADEELILMDTSGEVPHEKLREFFAQYVQPAFNNWWGKEKQLITRSVHPGGISAQELPASRPVTPVEPTAVSPQPKIYPVNCPRCGGNISWNTDDGYQGFCPYCKILLNLTPG